MSTYAKQGGFDGPVAWDDAGTAGALSRWAAGQLARFLGWVALWCGAVFVTVVLLPVGAVVPMTVVLAVLMYNAVMSLIKLCRFGRMRRILTVYPWRQQPGGVRYDARGRKASFVLPDPDRPEKTVSPKISGFFFRPWDRIARRGLDGDLWYAGDPRFACVIAEPGLRTLTYAAQPTAFDTRTDPRRKGLSPEARARARAIGARVAD
ncbi:hypothetical protein IM697_43840 [Streptomyces ferrugineus]|uniref:Uncharacterized protein n=1 Tax=Streptomyces ferrugineus TaxID=1413221 RepID=A0A7M2SNJ5_9ACTN|nr:hypothetical protein [Streptomyces ferrugineus]QOV36811.1 hypothetical protein IM697_43840 [Streptomyces ferrugineus]